MNRGRRNNNGQRARRPPPASRQELNALRREMTGHATVPAPNPPQYIQRPWNSWTFQRTEFTTADFEAVPISVGDIIDQIRSRCNINTEGPSGVGNQISIRISAAQAWVTASSLIQPDMECLFFELNPNDSNAQVRYTQRDVGTLNMPAKCGYHYPYMDSKEVLASNDRAVKVMTVTAAATGSKVTTRVQVLWRSSS